LFLKLYIFNLVSLPTINLTTRGLNRNIFIKIKINNTYFRISLNLIVIKKKIFWYGFFRQFVENTAIYWIEYVHHRWIEKHVFFFFYVCVFTICCWTFTLSRITRWWFCDFKHYITIIFFKNWLLSIRILHSSYFIFTYELT